MKSIIPHDTKKHLEELCAHAKEWHGTNMDLGTIELHEALLIRSIREHRCKGCSTLVTVEANDEKVYSVHWSN